MPNISRGRVAVRLFENRVEPKPTPKDSKPSPMHCAGQGGTLYTQAEDSILRERYHEAGPTALAAEMGRSPGSIMARAAKLGLAKKAFKWTPEAEQTLTKLWVGGTHQSEIIQIMGVSQGALYARLRELGLRHRRPRVAA